MKKTSNKNGCNTMTRVRDVGKTTRCESTGETIWRKMGRWGLGSSKRSK
jgi:hypothetical protein